MADKPTILIVDDAPENLSVLSGLLLPHDGVRVANSGARALRIAASTPIPDLVLLDVMMPGLDGYEVIKRLKADPMTRDIPVIFITALSANEDEYRGLALGASDYIGKPVKPALVLARIRAHLELKQARDRLRDENVRLEAEVERRSHQREQILLCVGEGICGTDAHGNIVFVNPAAAVMLGYTREALIGRHAHATFHLPRCDAGPETSEACPLCACLCGGHAIRCREDHFRLKIDQSFVRGLTQDSSSAAIARAIISLSHSLGLSVIAEGVETREQLAFLYAHDWDEMQGYLFSRPVPAGELEILLCEGHALALPRPEETAPFRSESTLARLGLPSRP